MSPLHLHIHDDIPAWLHAVNQAISMPILIDHYGFPKFKDTAPDVLVGPCPLHHGRNEAEFYVYGANSWACYGGCHRGGTPLDFVRLKEGVDSITAALLLQSWFSLDLVKLKLVPETVDE